MMLHGSWEVCHSVRSNDLSVTLTEDFAAVSFHKFHLCMIQMLLIGSIVVMSHAYYKWSAFCPFVFDFYVSLSQLKLLFYIKYSLQQLETLMICLLNWNWIELDVKACISCGLANWFILMRDRWGLNVILQQMDRDVMAFDFLLWIKRLELKRD